MTTMYDGRSFSHSHHLCQLPTPRSSIESSEPEGRPPSFISTAKEWESPTNPENSLQTPSSSTTSLDIPAPVVKPSPPRTHGGDGVVDDVKYYLKGQHQSNVQEFQDIGLEEFDQLHEALSDSRLRYDFDADLKTLIIRMPKASHEESAMGFFRTLDGSMKHQEEACGQALPWSLGTGLESRIGRSKSRFVADVTIHNDFNKPLLITEVRHTQARNNALKKIAKRMDGIPTLVGSIIINVDESPAYSPYTTPASPNDHISESQWKEIVKEAPAFGPIHYQDRCWMGSVTCSLDVRLQGEAKLRVEQAGIIPQSSTVDVDIALQDIWDMVVRDVAGASTDPVPLTVDWKMFRDKLRVSLGRTAYARYEDWYDSYGVQPGREASGDLGSVRLTRAKKRERKI